MIDKIKYYITDCKDPYENLATELYLTETAGEGECILFLWQNSNTIVIGRNQNAWQECRISAFEEDGGHLTRRLSGGGAVFHDDGNLNFTFCMRSGNYDLRKQQAVIVEACRLLGIPAEISGRNDLLTGGRKFSGNSFYSHEGHSFHNGTLLLNADMNRLGKYLSPSRAKLSSKGVASVRSRVVNLCELKPELTVNAMELAMISAFESVYGLTATECRRDDFDRDRLDALRAFFSSWDWIYGKNVPFTSSFSERFAWGEVTMEFFVENGAVRDAAIWTDALDADFPAELAESFKGCRMLTAELCEKVCAIDERQEVKDDLISLLRAQDQ